jgi:multidrug resistance efflux pump
LILALVLAVPVVAGSTAYYWRQRHAPVSPIGVVHETEIHISAEVGGRLKSVLVTSGQHVHRGDPLAELSIPELTASVGQSIAAAAKSQADRDNVFSGVRKEEIDQSAQNVEIAESNLVLAQQQFARTEDLASKGIESQQQLDEISTSLHVAENNLSRLKAIYEQDKAGPTREERFKADVAVTLAKAATADLEAQLAKTRVFSPVDGVVRIIVAAPGEVLSPGQAILTLEAGQQRWFTFTIREDRLDGLTLGHQVKLETAKGGFLEGRVTELRPLGEFATWRAARAVDDHDLNSFLVRVDPAGTSQDLQPGMSVWLDPVPRNPADADAAR